MEIIQFENQLAKSNCFMVVDWDSKLCLIIDPASELSENEIKYIDNHNLILEYIILTHGHADHCWGVNSLRDAYPDVKLIYSESCKYKMKKEIRFFFLLHSKDPNYSYEMKPAEIQITNIEEIMNWHNHIVKFILTPGHSPGSMCIEIDKKLFTGDTIMPYPPYFNKRGSSEEEWLDSVKRIENQYNKETIIYPGHGDAFSLGEWLASENSKIR